MAVKIDEIRKALAESNTQQALSMLGELLKSLELSDLRDELLIISAQYQRYSKAKRIEILSTQEENITINRIHDSITQIINQVSLSLKEENENLRLSVAEVENNSTLPDEDEIKRFCRCLIEEIKILNIESNWNSNLFVPLKAKVLLESQSGFSSAMDLTQAISKDKKAKAILVLGEPGSGKSVALRKLCEDFLIDYKSKHSAAISLSTY